MATETETIKIEVDSTGAVQDTKKLENAMDDTAKAVEDVGKTSESSFATLSNAARGAGAALAGLLTVELVQGFFAVNMEFDKLRAMLLTATGGAIEAAAAFEQVKAFAATTPFSLQQATEGFVKLKNLGLDPTVEAMTAFGDFSAAMGKELTDMIEAVADASTFEFERLKEFGIKSAQQGDFVTFTFRGVQTTIEKTADAVVAEIIRMSQANFGGAMAAQVDTLAGQLSNLEDTWNQTVDEMLQDDKVFRDLVAGITGYIQAFKDSIQDINGFFVGFKRIVGEANIAVAIMFNDMSHNIQSTIIGIQTKYAEFQVSLSKTTALNLVAPKIGAAYYKAGTEALASLEQQTIKMNEEQKAFNENIKMGAVGLAEETDAALNAALGIKSAAEKEADRNRQLDDSAHLLKAKMQHEDAATMAAMEHTQTIAAGSALLDAAKTPLEKYNEAVAALNANTKIKPGTLEYYEKLDEAKAKFKEASIAAESAGEKLARVEKELRAAHAASGGSLDLLNRGLAAAREEYQKSIQKTDEYKSSKKAEAAAVKEAAKEMQASLRLAESIFSSTETAAEKYDRQLKAVNIAYRDKSSAEYVRSMQSIDDQYDKATESSKEWQESQKAMNEQMSLVESLMSSAETATQRHAKELEALKNAMWKGVIPTYEEYLRLVELSDKKLAESSEKAKESTGAFEDAAKDIESSFSDLFSDIFSDAGNSFDNFAESLKKSFLNLLAQLAAEAIKNKIFVTLGISAEGGGLGGFISGLGSKITSGIGSLFTNPGGVLEKVGGFVSSIPGLLTGAKWGAGLLGLGTASTAGAAGATAAAGAPAAGGAGLFSGAGMMSALSVVGAIAGIGTLLYSIFGGSKKPIPDIAGFNTGLATDEIASVVAQDIKDKFRDSFDTAQTTSAFGTTIFGRPHGGGNKGGLTPDQWNELTEGLQTRLDAMTALDEVAAKFLSADQEQSVIDAIKIGITGGANKIEIAQAVKERYSIILSAIDDDLASAFNAAVGAVSGIEDTDKVLKAADDLLAIYAAFSDTGLADMDFSTALAMSQKLAGANGDLSDAYAQLAEKTTRYNALFGDAVDAEQVAIEAITGLRGEFEALGFAMPETKDGFRVLVDGLDMTTEAGRDTYLSLLDLAPGFADIRTQATALDDALTQIASGFEDAGVSMSSLLDDSIQKYLEFNFTPEQKQQAIGSEIDTLLTGLEQIVDPAQILDTVSKINQLTNEGFQLLTDEEQAGRAQQYAEFLQQVKDQADAQLLQAKEQALQDAQALQQAIRDALQPASDAQLQAAQLQIASAQLAYETAQIPVSVSVSFDTAEVGR